MRRYILLTLTLLVAVVSSVAQNVKTPAIGAQIFIEPGQTPQEIDRFFAVMEECGMTVGRIRMFGTHLCKEDGSWDFSLYDTAFECADRHGVKLFATLFPPTDELTDVGGFKFPESEEHLAEVEKYVRAVVTHFKDKPALDCWVLQNEPGLEKVMDPDSTPLSKKLMSTFVADVSDIKDNGYLKMPFEKEKFLLYYTDWYLKRISDIIVEIDPDHGRHINPHQILRTLPEYDFPAFEEYLTSMGSSMHASWHFGDFTRDEYPIGVALMSDIIANAAGKNPWWITEMQGGPVTASGNVVLCPTRQETTQTLWTGIFSGTEGVMFWTLNPRMAVKEAGEWSLLDFTGGKSDRLEAIAEHNSMIAAHSDFFKEAVPVKSDITILYSKESFWAQNDNLGVGKSTAISRSASSIPSAMIAAYKAVSASGLSPVIQDIERFDFDPAKTVILPNMIALSDAQVEKLCDFVKNGGNMISTGMTWYYDAGMRCRFANESPLYQCLGGRLKEFNVGPEQDCVSYKNLELTNEHWTGIIIPENENNVIACRSGKPIALKNQWGKGQSIWFPSMIDIGSRIASDDTAIAEFYREVCSTTIEESIFSFDKVYQDVFCRALKNGDDVMMLLVNKSSESKIIKINGIPKNPVIVDGDGTFSRGGINLPADGYMVLAF